MMSKVLSRVRQRHVPARTASRRNSLFLLLLLTATGLPSLASASPKQTLDEPLDAKLTDSAGKEVQLSQFRGKPTVLFYEDRESREQNRKVKDELWKRGKETGLNGAANVVGVANLEGFDFWPARNFARSAVVDVEKKVGIKVLIDWKGALTSAPWSLPKQSSTVVLLDKEGSLRYTYSGPMTEKEMSELFDKLAALLEVPPEKNAAKK
jgi:hypothetical protein